MLVCLLFCVQVGAKRRETTNFMLTKLPEVTLKAHDQNIVGHSLPKICWDNTRISLSLSRTKFKS